MCKLHYIIIVVSYISFVCIFVLKGRFHDLDPWATNNDIMVLKFNMFSNGYHVIKFFNYSINHF